MTRTKKTTASADKTAPRKRAAKQAPVKPATKEEEKLEFARDIARAILAHIVAIQKHPVGKKQCSLERLARFNKQIRTASTAMTSHQLQKVAAVGSTTAEAKARAELVDQVKMVRDAVSALAGVDQETARAFGVGARLSATSNADALLVSSQQQQAYAVAAYAAKAQDAGIEAEHITALMVARRALTDAASKQAAVRTGKTGQAVDKKALIQALSKETTALRKVAEVVFRKRPGVLAAFQPAPKKPGRKPKRKPSVVAQAGAGVASNGAGATQTATAPSSNGAGGTQNATVALSSEAKA